MVRDSLEPNALEIHNCSRFGDLAWLCSVCKFGQVAAGKAVDAALIGVDRTAGKDFVAVHTDTAGLVGNIAAGLVDHTAAADTVLGIEDSYAPPVPGLGWATVGTS